MINTDWNLSDNEHTFILRYYLPCLPQYEAGVTERRLSELIEFCKNHSIGAVMFYVDLNPYWYYMPDTPEHNEYVVQIVKNAARELKKEGISYQLNYQNLFGSWDGNYDHRKMLPWECYVDEFGKESYGVACMCGAKFRQIAGGKLKLWAETKPDAIWIDDDIRLHNHGTETHDVYDGKLSGANMDFGCFCDEHIKNFNLNTKNKYTRREIAEKCLEDTNLRKAWMNFQNDCLCDTSRWIENIVHSESPDTRVAVMTSVADVHSVEGRHWGSFLKSLSGDKVPLIRPTFGPYCEPIPRDFAVSFSRLESLKCNIDNQYGEVVDYCPEIENTRFTRYSKSIAATSYQMGLSAFLGCRGVTLSIFDLEGCILSEEPEFGELLDVNKAFCDMMNREKTREYKDKGISFIISPDRVQTTNFDNKMLRFSNLADIVNHNPNTRNFDLLFAKAGVPIKYSAPQDVSNTGAVALNRYSVSILSDEEIRTILSKSAFLDGGAADELIKRGFCEYIGIKSMKKNKSIVSSELLHTEKRSDNSLVIVPCRISGSKWYEVATCGCETLSSFITPGGEKYPGFTRFENTLGGKIIVYNAEDDYGDAFYSNYRIKLLKKICKYLQPDIITVEFPSYGLAAVRTNGEKTMVFVANLSTDPCCDLTVLLPQYVQNATVITSGGDKTVLSTKNGSINLTNSLTTYGYSVVMF